jgi:drug/metabolite transporter (DMT)-like permease
MLRGSVVVFTGILSVVFLKRRLRLYHWLGMLLVCTGALVVGSSSLTAPAAEDDSSHPAVLAPSNPFLGNVLIVCAQVIVPKPKP